MEVLMVRYDGRSMLNSPYKESSSGLSKSTFKIHKKIYSRSVPSRNLFVSSATLLAYCQRKPCPLRG